MFQLRDYQLELINSIYHSISDGNKKIMVQSPAGSGKSVTMSEIAKRATDKDNRVLFIVHRRELVNQIKQTFTQAGVNMDLCHVGMVQTVKNKLTKLKQPKIILVDEAHHALAKSYTTIFDYFSNSYVLAFTATPIRLSGKGFVPEFQDLILGKTVEWLIDNKRLAPFKYYSVNLTDTDKLRRASTGDYSSQSIDDSFKSTIYGDVVKHYEKLANSKKTIIYTHNVSSSKHVADKFNLAGHLAMQVDGQTDKTTRLEAMQKFRSGEVKILVNAELYGEGVDVPDCECVILLRPTESLSLHIQQTMRAMRYLPNKTATIIDHVGNYTRHGLPDRNHDWMKYFKATKKERTRDSENDVLVSECPSCFGVFESGTKTCPLCGYEIPIETKEMKEVDSELTLIEGGFKIDPLLAEYANKDKTELKTIEDYYLYAVAKDIKIAWIKFQVPELKNKEWWQFHQALKPIKQKYNY